MGNYKQLRGQMYAPMAIAIALLLSLSGVGIERLHAQAAAAAIQGTVTDASGAGIPDAAVQVRNVATGVTQNTATNAQGHYNAADLGIGDYDIQVSKMGFATTVRKAITVTVGSESVVDFALQVGQQTQTVTVEAQASTVEVTNASVGSLIGGQQMSSLPINGRNFESLIMLSPGVQTVNTMAPNARQGRANVFSAAGARPEGFTLLMDDEAIDNFFRRGMGTITGSSLGMEAMAEFQTLTNTYGAQFGGNGAVMNAVSKSGTNQYHGSLYAYLRNSATDARGFFDNIVKSGATTAAPPPFRRFQPGGSVGGPIKKDKMFFFFNYEGIWQLQEITKIAFVPDANHRTPPASLAASNPLTYAAVLNTLALYPPATFALNPAAGTGQTYVSGDNIAHENYILGRYDYNLNEKDSFFVRYFYDKQHVIDPYNGGNGSVTAGYLPYWPERDEGRNHFLNTEWRRVISPTLLNTARVSFSRPNTGDYMVNSFPALQLVFPGAGRPDADVGITGLTPLGQSFFVPAVDIQNRFTEADDLVWTKNRHTIHIGLAAQRVDSNVFYPFRSGSVWSFTGGIGNPANPVPGSFLSGTAGANGATGTPTSQATCMALINTECYTNRDYREMDFTPYFQDDWKITSRLTLNLGIRYEFATNPIEIHNDLYSVTNYLTNTTLINTKHPNAQNPNRNNWDPRFGFAYDVFSDHKTALRGGFAITHSPIFVAQYNPDFTAVTPWPGFVQNNPTYPNINFAGVLNSVSPGYDYNISKAPYLIQYNLNIERQIAEGTVFNIGYIGSHGVDMLTEQERNPPPFTIVNGVYDFRNTAGTALNPRINPNFSTLLMSTTGTTSRYNSLQTSVTRRMTRNLQAQVAYTFSKCIDDGSSPLGSISGGNTSSVYENPYLRDPTDVGLCYFNAKSTLRVNGVYNLPFKGNAIVSGWQISGLVTQNTGLPFSPYIGADTIGWAGSSNARPNVVAGCKLQTGFPTQWYNPACYSLPAPGTLGNAGRDTIIGPGLAELDMSLSKETRISRISENFRVQLRVDAFNIFNHPQFGQPGNSMFSSAPISSTTGQYTTSTPNGSAGVISSLAGNTAARQFQFGLKILF